MTKTTNACNRLAKPVCLFIAFPGSEFTILPILIPPFYAVIYLYVLIPLLRCKHIISLKVLPQLPGNFTLILVYYCL